MAVTLPTVTVTDAQGARILDAFKTLFGVSTRAEAVTAYKRWLVTQVRTTVVACEAGRLSEEANAAARDAIRELETMLPNPDLIEDEDPTP